MKFICPLILVTDISKSKEFYCSVLNQEIKTDFGENVTFSGDFAIHLKSHFKNLIDNREIKSEANNFELYFEEDDIETVVSKLKTNNVEFIHELKEQPWMQRAVRFYDPDKNIIEIGESMEFVSYRLYMKGNSVDGIVKMTGLSAEFVTGAIQTYKKEDR
ncbi:MAG: VOC family protein [Bacteroidales bacterium]|jgi:catechol 2,3-dioxygenase-like lactoylglutathione lyase family enzyme|nr:VOC family protein [Bacteroidales bacterium]